LSKQEILQKKTPRVTKIKSEQQNEEKGMVSQNTTVIFGEAFYLG
jgi:hypothetical protein